ncbi:MAG: nucleotide sugar dehydrogenase [Candidatus Magasanikbacteria bacterium]|nr:nucleotide sugar dehydrogenase [Candidatus Magasanikbacteria bacterium]
MIESQAFRRQEAAICVVGLGYVGLPLAVRLAKHFRVIGFDIQAQRIAELRQGFDRTREVGESELAAVKLNYTDDPAVIREARFIIVAVPTPVDKYNVPDLSLVRRATETVGQYLRKESVVVYESTVYPGVTEEVCVSILEKLSGLRCGEDFTVGYSPERVNPGDKVHTIDRVTKIVAGWDTATTALLVNIYGAITQVYRAPSIKVAEAAKVIENTQRDLNIALMNELAMVFHKMGISIYDVLAAAGTKWNFLPFTPGLVGGHCIGVDPYYLTYQAEAYGHHPEVILAGRHINDTMPTFLAAEIIKAAVKFGHDVRRAQWVIWGITFKENVPDVRNSKVAALYRELEAYGIHPTVYDPLADATDVVQEYGLTLCPQDKLPPADVLVVAVAHDEFTAYAPSDLERFVNRTSTPIVVDLKHIYNRETLEANGLHYWSL